MTFCTTINCMDGRVQLPVITFLQKRFNADLVDSITEPGPNRILSDQTPQDLFASIFNRIRISIEKHRSVGIAVVGHFDCAGNPTDRTEQTIQTQNAVDVIKRHYPNIPIIGLWVDEHWHVHELDIGH